MDRPETAPCDETQQLDETKQKLWTRSRPRACPLTVRARLLSRARRLRRRIVCVRACASPSLPFGARHSRCAASEAARSLLGVEVLGSGEE